MVKTLPNKIIDKEQMQKYQEILQHLANHLIINPHCNQSSLNQ